MAQTQHEKEARALCKALLGLCVYYEFGNDETAWLHVERIQSVWESWNAAAHLGPLNLVPRPEDRLREVHFRFEYWRRILRPVLVASTWPKIKGDGTIAFKMAKKKRAKHIKTLSAAVVYWDKMYMPPKRS